MTSTAPERRYTRGSKWAVDLPAIGCKLAVLTRAMFTRSSPLLVATDGQHAGVFCLTALVWKRIAARFVPGRGLALRVLLFHAALFWAGPARAAPLSTIEVPLQNTWLPQADLAISGTTLGVGTGEQDRAYVFVKAGATYALQATTLAPGGAGSGFGTGVALQGDRAVVSAPYEVNGGLTTGAVYVFERSGTTWTQAAKLTPAPAVHESAFGEDVALDGTRLVVGAPSERAAYVFELAAGSWQQRQRLAGGVTDHYFGASVAVSGNRVLVGALGATVSGLQFAGKAMLYECGASTCTLSAALQATTPREEQYFGYSVALSGGRALVGAPDIAGFDFIDFEGSVFVYELTGGVWQRTHTLSRDANVLAFGSSVALQGARAVVGAPSVTDFITPGISGVVYVYDLVGGNWLQREQLQRGGGSYLSFDFGRSVSLDATRAVAAAYLANYDSTTEVGTNTAVVYEIALSSVAAAPASTWLSAGLVAGLLMILAVGYAREAESRCVARREGRLAAADERAGKPTRTPDRDLECRPSSACAARAVERGGSTRRRC
jgi:hypothetical protein